MQVVKNPLKKDWSVVLKRPTKTVKDIEAMVEAIFQEIVEDGDEAVKKYTEKFDGVKLNELAVSSEEIEAAEKEISEALKQAIGLAKNNIESFHSAQKTNPVVVETQAGVTCWQQKKPITKVGLYIPGGSAPLFSSVLMLALPAKIAGCQEIILCSPPDKRGKIHPAILFAAKLCGVTQIFKAGGIQAIGALTFGTASIPKVYKIFGPGNQYVTVAKQLATQYHVGIDMPAGPSELLVMADETAIPAFVAADLLSQAEHGADSQVILVTTSSQLLAEVQAALIHQLEALPRKETAQRAIDNSKIILLGTKEEALELINEYAPEHFIVCTQHNDYFVENIENAGSVFIGNYTPESAGDYASGTNHTLPTNGYAKQYSGVNLDAFTKSITFQEISEVGITSIGKAVEIMAEAEGLTAHKNAMTLRIQHLKRNA